MNRDRRPLTVLCSLVLFALLSAGSSPSAADTLEVPSEYPTIQVAVDAAVSGDVILVAAGTYPESVSIEGKDIQLTGEDASVTIIEAGGHPTGIYLAGPISSTCTVQEFTIQNATAFGIQIFQCDPTIQNCISRQNSLAGMRVYDSASSVTSCHFIGNAGRGLNLELAIGTFTSCNIQGNTTAGIYAWNASDAAFSGCIVQENQSRGVYTENSSPQFNGCIIRGNVAAQGAGMYLAGGSPVLDNCLIHGNSAEYGGGLYVDGSSPVIRGCTISRNQALSGGGICTCMSNFSMERTIVWGNCATDHYEIFVPEMTIGCRCSDVRMEGVGGSGVLQDLGDNIEEDPLFCDMGPCPAEATIEGDFHLATASPCATGPCGQQIGYYGVACGTSGATSASWGRMKTLFRRSSP